MERLKKIIGDTVFVAQILILFILVFESRIEVPALLQAAGRLHPLMLHLPIGLLLVSVVLLFLRRHFEGKSTDELISLLFHFTALTASFTTLMGLLLSFEGTFAASQMGLHKWLGVALSFLCWGLLAAQSNVRVLKPAGIAGVVLLIFTGHYGANLTHGVNFVWAPLQPEPQRVARVITDSTALFTAAVEPILESKCYGCHNPKKAKGNLVLTSLDAIQKGGKNGALWKPGDAAHSLIVKRLLLPMEHDEHMPPRDKAQLTEDEIAFISLWIEHGADTRRVIKQFAKNDTLRKLASAIIPRYQVPDGLTQQYTFKFASPEKISKLSIPNRTVAQIATNEPAIAAEFYLRESFDKKYLDELVEVGEQLVSLNLSKMPLKDAGLETIKKFHNLEELNLNNTDITGAGLKALATLPRLRTLSVSGTDVSPEALRALGNASALKEVFIWNTPVTEADVVELSDDFPHIAWNIGYIPDAHEILRLNAPMAANKTSVLKRNEKARVKHNLPGTVIRYTTDGTNPDSLNSPVFKAPLDIGHFASIRARAFKEGWLSSEVAEFVFFREGFRPDSIALLTSPDKQFKGDGVAMLFDGQKGLPSFYRHPAWMAFKDDDLVVQFSFNATPPEFHHVTLSFADNGNSICLPPEEMQLWGGNDPSALQLIAGSKYPEGKRPKRPQIDGVSLDVSAPAFKYYKLVAKPRRSLAKGNPRKRDLWLMVDEIFLN